jgi:hypothetical protein
MATLELLTAVTMNSSVFWDVMFYNPTNRCEYFGGTCCLLFQGRRIKMKADDFS